MALSVKFWYFISFDSSMCSNDLEVIFSSKQRVFCLNSSILKKCYAGVLEFFLLPWLNEWTNHVWESKDILRMLQGSCDDEIYILSDI